MNSYEAERQGKMAIYNALIAVDCKDGVKLTEEQIKDEQNPIFWLLHAPQSTGKKKTYITYYVIFCTESDNYERADNQVLAFSFEGSVDVFSKSTLSDRIIVALLDTLTEELENQGFNVEMGPDLYENETGTWHKPITISKEIL